MVLSPAGKKGKEPNAKLALEKILTKRFKGEEKRVGEMLGR